MADKEFTQICKEILGIGKRLEKIEPDELRKIKADIEQISATIAAHKASFDANKEDFDGKYSGMAEIIKTLDTLKAQIEEVLKSGVINDDTKGLISTYSSKKIMDLLNEVKRQFVIGGDVAPLISNLDDTTTPTGFYKTSENTTVGTFPSAFGKSIHANVLVERLDGNWLKQTLTNIGTDPRMFIRTNNFSAKKWNDWQEVLMGAKNSASSANSVVARDENGDFAGRWITADHFLMGTKAQDNIFDENSEIAFRQQQLKENDPKHIRFVTAKNFAKQISTPLNTANTIVGRDANGDFAGRFISAGHFRLMAQQQNNLFHNGCDLLFRTSSADDQNYVRGVNANYAATIMGVIGIGQSWQNVTAQRAANVTYTNTTGRPIQVFVQSHNLHQSGSFVINGIPFQFAFAAEAYLAGQNVSFIVPAGNTYSVDLPFSMWLELR